MNYIGLSTIGGVRGGLAIIMKVQQLVVPMLLCLIHHILKCPKLDCKPYLPNYMPQVHLSSDLSTFCSVNILICTILVGGAVWN
jgi:hypothetical protein